MKILQAKEELVVDKAYPGLFTCKFTHKIKETSAAFRYTGPKFSPAMWSEILAFFKWSYDKTHGESQVRLFVHPEQGWRAWAFPQEASTGLATSELPNHPDAKIQREQFGDGWILYGTVHHHCSASAFQSGTDESNEKNQEGIHITVGNMDQPVYSLHFRFYYLGCKFQPDLTEFWDVGEEAVSESQIILLKYNLLVDLNRVAEGQMAKACAKDAAFPEQWKANLIEKVVPAMPTNKWDQGNYWGSSRATGMVGGVEDPGFAGYPSRVIKALRKRYRKAYKDEIKEAGGLSEEMRESIDDEVEELIFHVTDDKDILYVLELIKEHQTTIGDLDRKFQEVRSAAIMDTAKIDEKEIQEELEEERAAQNGHGGVTALGDAPADFYTGYGCT